MDIPDRPGDGVRRNGRKHPSEPSPVKVPSKSNIISLLESWRTQTNFRRAKSKSWKFQKSSLSNQFLDSIQTFNPILQ